MIGAISRAKVGCGDKCRRCEAIARDGTADCGMDAETDKPISARSPANAFVVFVLNAIEAAPRDTSYRSFSRYRCEFGSFVARVPANPQDLRWTTRGARIAWRPLARAASRRDEPRARRLPASRRCGSVFAAKIDRTVGLDRAFVSRKHRGLVDVHPRSEIVGNLVPSTRRSASRAPSSGPDAEPQPIAAKLRVSRRGPSSPAPCRFPCRTPR